MLSLGRKQWKQNLLHVCCVQPAFSTEVPASGCPVHFRESHVEHLAWQSPAPQTATMLLHREGPKKGTSHSKHCLLFCSVWMDCIPVLRIYEDCERSGLDSLQVP